MGQPGSGGALPGMGALGPGAAPGGPAMPGDLSGGGAAGTLPPDILTGVMATGQQVSTLIDGLIKVTPELGADWQALKQLLTQTLSKILIQGSGPVSPTASGMNAFPGGGFERGSLPAPGMAAPPA